MSVEPADLPDDIDSLKALVGELQGRLEHEVSKRDQEIALLRERLNRMLAQRFGASSERTSDAQLGLFNEAEFEAERDEPALEDDTQAVEAHTRRRGKRKPLDATWPRVDIEHDLDEADKVCPHDGTPLTAIGTVDSEQLDIVPATVQVLRHRRHKYACPCCEQYVVTAPMVAQPIPKSRASPGLLAFIATGKYVDSLPLYRQAAQLERLGLDCSRTTLARWMVRCGELVQPLINLLDDELRNIDYLQCDETTVQVLDEAGKPAQSTSYLWARRSGVPERPIVLFDYAPSRSSEVARELLEGFSGYLQTDGYAGYNAPTREGALKRVFCFAHARRKFVDVCKSNGVNLKKLPVKLDPASKRAVHAINLIKTLYTIERRIKERPSGERLAVRQTESIPVLEKLKTWLDSQSGKVRPSSALGEAITYAVHHWEGLIRYCEDGRLHIDNNLVENDIRPFCLGRRNWLFSQSTAGAHASARLYSLIVTAKANGLQPYAYLRYLFTELPKAQTVEHIEALLPYRLDPKLIA